jgi:hypothetical protein
VTVHRSDPFQAGLEIYVDVDISHRVSGADGANAPAQGGFRRQSRGR